MVPLEGASQGFMVMYSGKNEYHIEISKCTFDLMKQNYFEVVS